MKVFVSASLIIVLNIFSSPAQNYQTVNSGTLRFFIDTTGYIRAIKMDSAQISGSDSLLFPFKTTRDTCTSSGGLDCIFGYGPSWIGQTVIIKSDGTNIFLNQNNDSIYFNTLAQVGIVWRLYTFPNNDYADATVDSVSYISVLASSDSVKYISLQVKDSFGNNIAHALNGKQFILSKDNGFVQLYDFYFFPDYSFSPPSNFPNENAFLLTGEHIPTMGEVYDFDVGDEFETRSGPYCASPTWTYSRFIVTSKTFSAAGDTICYNFFNRRVTYTYVSLPTPHYDSLVYVFTFNNICYTNLNSPFINFLPEESVNDAGDWYQYHYYRNNNYCSQLYITKEWGCNNWGDSCLEANHFECPYFRQTQITGCFLLEYYHEYVAAMFCEETYLTYLKKDSCVYGSPHIWTDVNEHLINPHITVYPNPASSEFFIVLPPLSESFYFELSDVTGRIVIPEFILTAPKQKISVDTLPNGVYFLKISDGNNFSFQKIIVSH